MKTLKALISPIKLIFTHSPLFTTLKVLQVIFTALVIPLNIFIAQNIIDSSVAFISNDTATAQVVFWVVLMLLISMVSATISSLFGNLIEVEIRKQINQRMSPILLEKFISLDYCCYEDANVHNIMELVGDNPQERIYRIFKKTLNLVGIIISIVGVGVVLLQAAWWFVTGFIVLFILATIIEIKSAAIYHNMFTKQTPEERKKQYYEKLLSEKHSLFELRLFNATGHITRRWMSLANKIRKK